MLFCDRVQQDEETPVSSLNEPAFGGSSSKRTCYPWDMDAKPFTVYYPRLVYV